MNNSKKTFLEKFLGVEPILSLKCPQIISSIFRKKIVNYSLLKKILQTKKL